MVHQQQQQQVHTQFEPIYLRDYKIFVLNIEYLNKDEYLNVVKEKLYLSDAIGLI